MSRNHRKQWHINPLWRVGFQAFVKVLLLSAFMVLSGNSLIYSESSDEEPQEAPKFVEPIITEETLPNEPGELSIRLSTEYRKDGGSATAVLPRFQIFYGPMDRLGMELDLPMAYREEEASNYGLGDLSASLKLLLIRHGPEIPAVVLGLEAGFPTG